jgi:tRNA-specific 2-thiouridylase
VNLSGFLFINETPDRDYSIPQPVAFKIRHQPEFNFGIMIRTGQGTYRIDSGKSIAGVAPGQFGVIYDVHHKICLGSGVIADEC